MLSLSQMRDFIITLLPPEFPKEKLPTAVLNEIMYQQMLVLQLEHINTILPVYLTQVSGTLNSTTLMTTPNITVASVLLPANILQIENNIKSVVVAYSLPDLTGYMPQPAKILELDQFIKESADGYTTNYNNPIATTDKQYLYVSPAYDMIAPIYQLWYYRVVDKPTNDNSTLDIPAVYLGELAMKVVNYVVSLFTITNQQLPAFEQAIIYRKQAETTRSVEDAITRP